MPKTLILCVDRDNDIGRKLGIEGPIIGVRENINVAKELAIKDPEDSDVNAIFGAVKLARELNTKVVTLTGDKYIGVTSDTKIAKQLDRILNMFNPDGVILVTDGTEDEQIIPIISSRVKINSIRTIVVRQSIELEKAYFKINQFIKEVEEDPDLARLVFGIPGLAIMILSIGVLLNALSIALGFMLAFFGAYFLIKGLGLEEEVFSRLSNFLESLSIEKISTVTYIISFIIFSWGVLNGYLEFDRTKPPDIMEAIAVFFVAGADMILIAFVVSVIGRIIDELSVKRYLGIRRDLILLSFGFLIYLILKPAATIYLPLSPFQLEKFILSTLIGILTFLAVIYFTKYLFIDEIRARERLIKMYSKKDVFDEAGNRVGRVSRVLLDSSNLLGIKIGRKRIPKEDILSVGDSIIIKIPKKSPVKI